MEENREFAEAQGFGYPLLSDPDKTVGRRYEVVAPADSEWADYAMRIAYLIGPDGTIRRSYKVSDVAGFATAVLADLEA